MVVNDDGESVQLDAISVVVMFDVVLPDQVAAKYVCNPFALCSRP